MVKNPCAMEKISFLRNHNSAYKLPILFLVLLLLDCFGLKIVHYRFLDYVFLSIIIILAAPAIKVKGTYPSLIMGYCIFVLLSCFYSWIYNRQGLITVIGHSYTYFALLFFFILQRTNLSSKEAEDLFVKIALCFCFCYILQYIISPTVLFSGADDENKMNALKYRVRMPGSICGYFLILYAINRYLLGEKRKRNKYIFYAVIAFIPIIIQGFRSLVILTLMAGFLIIPFVLRSGKKTLVYSILGAVSVLFAASTSLVQTKVDEMIYRQEQDQTFENEDYIRFRSFDYYWNEQFTKPYEKLIGGGVPSDSKTSYYKNIRHVKDHLGFFWVDLGIIGLSMVIGMPAVILLVFMYLYCMWKCKEPRLQYIRFTLFVVLFGSIVTSMELYREGNILLLSLFLYIEYKYHMEQKFVDKLKKVNNVVRK